MFAGFKKGMILLTQNMRLVWLNIHHPIAATVIRNKEPITGFHTSSNVTSLHVDFPVVSSPTNTCSTSTTHGKMSTQSLTPVCPMTLPNPTQLNLTTHGMTTHSPSTPVSANSVTLSSGSSVGVSTKRSPLAELVNLPKIDYQKLGKLES